MDTEAILSLARTWAATVTVVTARRRPSAITPEAPEVDGFTATAFMMLSLDPPLLALGVGRDSGADDLLEDADFLAVNLLSEGQAELSHAFARHHRDRGDAWERFPWTLDAHGTPLLAGTTGAFSAAHRRAAATRRSTCWSWPRSQPSAGVTPSALWCTRTGPMAA